MHPFEFKIDRQAPLEVEQVQKKIVEQFLITSAAYFSDQGSAVTNTDQETMQANSYSPGKTSQAP